LKNQQIRVREEWDLLKPITTVIPAQAGGVVQEEWYRDAPFTEPRTPCTVYGPKDGIQTA
jgi:hypothetical protein